jgi:antitoxin component of MazEF toxin-antitoxin module
LSILIVGGEMRATVVRIGNSRGVRIPKSILAACGIEGAVDLSVADGKIVLAAAPLSSWLRGAVAEGSARHA